MDKAKVKALEAKLEALAAKEAFLIASLHRKQVSPVVEALGFIPAGVGFFHPEIGAHLSMVVVGGKVTHLNLERVKSRDDGKANRRDYLKRKHRLPHEVVARFEVGEGLAEKLQEKLSSAFSAILQGADVIADSDSFNRHNGQRSRRKCRQLPTRFNTWGWKPAKV
ncbi:MAG: hypothetical protein ACWGQW_15580 [bacterium]